MNQVPAQLCVQKWPLLSVITQALFIVGEPESATTRGIIYFNIREVMKDVMHTQTL